jgi:hypothetical protein
MVENGENWCWEPELALSSDGRVQLHYSFAGKSMNRFEQAVVGKESSDQGTIWGNRIISVGDDEHHVDMARITQGTNTYFMAVEVYEKTGCVHIVTSEDGKSWSDIASAPAMAIADQGWMFSAPALAWNEGVLFGLGKHDATGHSKLPPALHPEDGKGILLSKDEGQSWDEMETPFQIQYNDTSSYWSPTILPVSGSKLFVITNSDTALCIEIRK